ncbi:FKBP-like protein [Sphaerulina musiva SO2202]|uniref:Peptidyl-prolyl cis-trans isomerase n=1 Tax=Sphaerulina musiva (strain SO2202) TaxID=692275 RepID=N1QHN7_SPHMS|nr:FKBP-like protein [Sphaerulina musiva SO2202]EMF16695.1 FKBP-like protein [Sphaerulina musiva SO2202]
MAPKGKGAADKGKSKDSKDGGGKAAKAAQTINVRHILCEKHAKKQEALAKLNAGAKFDEVAREFSEDKARTGGALGWKTKEALLPEFSAVAFELAASTTANPVIGECKTTEGYHIIMVEGRK